MESLTIKVPAMYGDHHVLAVRRLLLEAPGVKEVYASSSFRVVEVEYDEGQVAEGELEALLEEAGYMGELPVPFEGEAASVEPNGRKAFMRHTVAFAQTGKTVGFAQKVPYAGRPLWPCPQMGPVTKASGGTDG